MSDKPKASKEVNPVPVIKAPNLEIPPESVPTTLPVKPSTDLQEPPESFTPPPPANSSLPIPPVPPSLSSNKSVPIKIELSANVSTPLPHSKPSTIIGPRPPAPQTPAGDSTIVRDFYYDDPHEIHLRGRLI